MTDKRYTSTEDAVLLTKLLLKYKNFQTGKGMKELMAIDFVRNNYSKQTVYNYYTGMKRYLRDGKIYKAMSVRLCKIADTLLNREQNQPQAYSEKVEEKEPTKEEKLAKLQEQLNALSRIRTEKVIALRALRDGIDKQISFVIEAAEEKEQEIHKQIKEVHKKDFLSNLPF